MLAHVEEGHSILQLCSLVVALMSCLTSFVSRHFIFFLGYHVEMLFWAFLARVSC